VGVTLADTVMFEPGAETAPAAQEHNSCGNRFGLAC